MCRFAISGYAVEGTGMGRRYLSVPGYLSRFAKILGREPYPGTLNVEISAPECAKLQKMLPRFSEKSITVFSENGKEYLPIRVFPCKVCGIESAYVIPSRTVHPRTIMEFVSPDYLRGKLVPGGKVEIEFEY
jgi:riboflavin kinase, archaea type